MCLGAIRRGCGFGRVENDDATNILLHHARQRLLERVSTVDSDDLAGWYHKLFDEHFYLIDIRGNDRMEDIVYGYPKVSGVK